MEVALTPLELARRARTLYPDREALVDGPLRLTYARFFERCDKWSAALQRLGVTAGDRVAFVALEGAREGWLDYETLLSGAHPSFERPPIEEGDLLTINYTSGTTSRPKGVMMT